MQMPPLQDYDSIRDAFATLFDEINCIVSNKHIMIKHPTVEGEMIKVCPNKLRCIIYKF